MKNYTAIISDLREREAGSLRKVGQAPQGSDADKVARENLAIIEDAIERTYGEAEAELLRLTS